VPEFNSNEWYPKKGKVTLQTTARHMVDIWVSCSKTVKVFGLSEKGATLLKSGEEFRFRGQVKGFEKIVIEGTGQTPFGLKVRQSALQDGEPNSGEKAPVISLPEPSNLLQQINRMQREHHAARRMAVLEPEEGDAFFNRHVLDDDEDFLFEEELLAKAQEAEEKARKDAETDASDDGIGPVDPLTPPEPPTEGDQGNSGLAPPENAQTA
jgi:hypothetical protein